MDEPDACAGRGEHQADGKGGCGGRHDAAAARNRADHEDSPCRGVGGGDAVVAVRPQPFDAGEFGQPARGTAPGEDGNKVDGLGDQGARDGDDSLLDELFEAAQRADAGTGMDGADPARMAGAPGFEQVEGFGPAHLADRDAVGAQAQRRTDQIGKRRHAILGPHRDKVGRGALQLARVLDDDDAIRVLATSASSALVSVVLPVLVPPATRILARAGRLRAASRPDRRS
jgi:hypothetical protein